MPMNSVSARISRHACSVRWPRRLCIRGRTTPPRTTSWMPSQSRRTWATSRRVRDDREVGPVDQLASELDRGGAAGHDDRLPVPDECLRPPPPRAASREAPVSPCGRSGRAVWAASVAPPYVRTRRRSLESRRRSRRMVDEPTPISRLSSSTVMVPRTRTASMRRSSRSRSTVRTSCHVRDRTRQHSLRNLRISGRASRA